jgi:hypothetical protein
MYVYYPFSPHNGITMGNLLILFFSPVNANFNFSCNYYCIFVLFILFFSYFYVFLSTRANFVIGFYVVKFTRK